MPLVRLIHKGCNFPTPIRLEEIKRELKEIVADALSCEDQGGSLTPQDIEVEVKVTEQGDSLHEQYAIMFYIDATDYPSRKASLEARGLIINSSIGLIPEFKNMRGFVWIRLFPATFHEFGPKPASP